MIESLSPTHILKSVGRKEVLVRRSKSAAPRDLVNASIKCPPDLRVQVDLKGRARREEGVDSNLVGLGEGEDVVVGAVGGSRSVVELLVSSGPQDEVHVLGRLLE